MRSAFLILVTLLLLAAGVFFFLWTDTKPRAGVAGKTDNSLAAPATRPDEMPDAQQHVGDVDNVWIRSYDAKTGELSNEFRAAKYKPTRGGEVKVERPEAKFYMGKTEPRQVMVL